MCIRDRYKRPTYWFPYPETLKGDTISNMNVPQNLKTEEEWQSVRHFLRPVMVSLIECKNCLLYTSLFDEFLARRGYKLEEHLPEFLAAGERSDKTRRIISDYRETLGELLQENFTRQWTEWAHRHLSLIHILIISTPGAMTRKVMSKRIWSLPAPVEPCAMASAPISLA